MNRKHFSIDYRLGNPTWNQEQNLPVPLHGMDPQLIHQCLGRPHAPPQILAFGNCKILLAVGVRRAETHHYAEFLQNQSIHWGDIVILLFFNMSIAVILDLQICEILLAEQVRRAETHHVKISPSIVKILRFLFFQDSGHPPFWICFRHTWTTYWEYLVVSTTMQNLVIINAVVLMSVLIIGTFGWKTPIHAPRIQ